MKLLASLRKEQRLEIAIGLGVAFMLAEIIAGIISNSLAILSDAIHLMSDVAGFAIALMAFHLSNKAANKQFTFGYARAEVFGAFASILILYIATIWLVVEAIHRAILWAHDEAEIVDGKIMFIMACFGILVNVILGLVFHNDKEGSLSLHDHSHEHGGHAHGHGHGHGHGRCQYRPAHAGSLRGR